VSSSSANVAMVEEGNLVLALQSNTSSKDDKNILL